MVTGVNREPHFVISRVLRLLGGVDIDIEKLEGLSLVLGVEEIKAANGGRLKFRGKIDRSSVPKQALRSNGTPSATAKTAVAAH